MLPGEDPSVSRKKRRKKDNNIIIHCSDQSYKHKKFAKTELEGLHCR